MIVQYILLCNFDWFNQNTSLYHYFLISDAVSYVLIETDIENNNEWKLNSRNMLLLSKKIWERFLVGLFTGFMDFLMMSFLNTSNHLRFADASKFLKIKGLWCEWRAKDKSFLSRRENFDSPKEIKLLNLCILLKLCVDLL